MKNLPSNSVDLIKELDKLYPDQMITNNTDEFERIKLAGKVELIRYLKNFLKPTSGIREVNANDKNN